MATRVQSDPRAREKPCLRCCTSLRAHLDARYCPQCGLSVWLSLNANDSLDSSRPTWLRATSKACFLLAIVQLFALASWAMYYLVFLRKYVTPESEGDEISEEYAAALHPTAWTPTPKILAITVLLAGIYFLLNAAGLIALTGEEKRYPDKQRTFRMAARITAGVTGAIGMLMLASGFLSLRPGAESNVTALTRDMTSNGLLLLAEFAFVATSVCLWLYLRPIATRGRRSGLRKVTSWLLFLPLIAFGKFLPIFVGFWIASIVLQYAPYLPGAYIPISIMLLFQFGRMLQKAAPHAEQTWVAESKPA